jgi:Thioredoxin domain
MNAVAIAAVFGALLVLFAQQFNKRRRPEPPTQQAWTVPQQLDRNDFTVPEAPWLVAVFTSATCSACERVSGMARVMKSSTVAVEVVEYQTRSDLHKRYGIDAVPTTVIADAEGVVVKSFVGPTTATDLWAAVAEAREPGSTPPPEAHRPRGH